MQSASRRHLALIVLLLFGLAGNLYALQLSRGGHVAIPPAATLPAEFQGYKSEPIAIDDATRNILNRASFACVRYRKPGELPVDALVVSSHDPNDMHRPQNCLVGSGFQIVSDEIRNLFPDGPQGPKYVFHRLIAHMGTDELVMVYGYEGLGEVTSTDAVRFKMLFGAARNEPANLLRFTTFSAGDTAGAEARLLDWATTLLHIRDQWKPRGAAKP